MFKLRLRIGFVLLLLMFGLVSSSPITSSISAGHKQSITINESDTPSADSPTLTWTARTQSVPTPLENDSSAVGDHVVLNATFPEELNVTRSEMRVWNGFTYTTTRPLVIPTDPDGTFEGIIDPAQFDWIVIKGVEKDLTVRISCNFTTSDCDFMAWDGTKNQSEYMYDNNIVDMASGDKPETDSFVWTSDNDTIVIACLNYAGGIGNWTLHFQAGFDEEETRFASSVEMDTYYMTGSNQTCSVSTTGFTDLNESIMLIREQVQICNFFVPQVTIYPIESLPSDDRTYNITWLSTDANADDVHYYSVWLSNTDGLYFWLIAQNLTTTWYLWNSSGYLEDDYMARVRAYSVDLTVPGLADVSDPPAGYWPGDYGDEVSWVGEPPPPAIYINLEKDSSYLVNSTGNTMKIRILFRWFNPAVVSYIVSDNGSLWIEDTLYPQTDSVEVNVSIDGLSVGYHILQVNASAEIYTRSRYTYIIVIDPEIASTTNSTSPGSATSENPFIPILLQTFLVISIPGIALIVLTRIVSKGFDRDIIKRMCKFNKINFD